MNKGLEPLLKQRYLWKWNVNGKEKQETIEMMFLRVAKKMASGLLNLPYSKDITLEQLRKKSKEFYSVMIRGDFIPSSPQLFNAMRGFESVVGEEKAYELLYKPLDKMLYSEYEQIAKFTNPKAAYGSCYSMGQIDDSIEGIYRVLYEQAEIFRI